MKKTLYFCLFLSLFSCKKEDEVLKNTIKITGNVINFENQKPIEDAIIVCNATLFSSNTASPIKSDKNGNFSFEALNYNIENISFNTSKKGFVGINEQYQFTSASTFDIVKSQGFSSIKTEHVITMIPSGTVFFDVSKLNQKDSIEIKTVVSIKNADYQNFIIANYSSIGQQMTEIFQNKPLSSECVADKPSKVIWQKKGETVWKEIPFTVKAGEAINLILK
jgi:hypothetical protein